MRFLGIILRVLRLEVAIYNVYITNQFQATFARGVGINQLEEVTVNTKEENSEDFSPMSKNSASVQYCNLPQTELGFNFKTNLQLNLESLKIV